MMDSVCYAYHAVPKHRIFILITLLEFLCDNVLAQLLIFHVHNRIVKIRIEFLADRFDRGHTQVVSTVISCL